MVTLALDASTYVGTVALVRDGEVVAEAQAAMRGEREERLMPAVASILGGAPVEIEAVACGSGPGSFTSLRIAASIAKGIAVARGVPLYAAPSPLLIVAGAMPPFPAGRYLAVIDAMRGDVFGMEVHVDHEGLLSLAGSAWLSQRSGAVERARDLGAAIVGPGEAMPHAPHARGFARLLAQRLAPSVDLAAWEPDYGRKAEAQVRWERDHGRNLTTP